MTEVLHAGFGPRLNFAPTRDSPWTIGASNGIFFPLKRKKKKTDLQSTRLNRKLMAARHPLYFRFRSSRKLE